MKKSGFSAGQNLTIEVVRTDQDSQRLFAETADLVRSNVELLVAEGSEIVLKAALAASRTIPIVILATNYDPIARGYVKSLAQPGGNITGIVFLQTELAAKQVELLAEAFPDRSRLAVLYDEEFGRPVCRCGASGEIAALGRPVAETGEPALRFRCSIPEPRQGSPQMLLVLSSQYFTLSRSHIAELAIQQRLPTMFIFKSYVEAGGLISYGVDPPAMYRQVGFYVAKILNGAKPADLPIQQPVKFELVINLKTAKAIGVDLSTAIQLRADEVIE